MPWITFALLTLSTAFARAEFQSGDMIFQTSNSNQSTAIMWATSSRYSHVGIIEVARDGVYVLEAIQPVSRTRLERWIQRGKNGGYLVMRDPRVGEREQKAIISAAKSLLGRPYDLYFTAQDGGRAIYCSELVDIAFRRAGLEVGRYQPIRSLNVNNATVRGLAQKRWRGHPICRSVGNFEDCWAKILNDELITPASIASDRRLKTIKNTFSFWRR